MHYICLVHNDRKRLEAISEEDFAKVAGECGAWVESLEKNGKHVFSAGLQSPKTATSIRKHDGEIIVTDGPYAETKEHLGGFTILEARDLNEAIQLASRLADVCEGNVEVRPLMDPFGPLEDPVDQKIASAIKGSMNLECSKAD